MRPPSENHTTDLAKGGGVLQRNAVCCLPPQEALLGHQRRADAAAQSTCLHGLADMPGWTALEDPRPSRADASLQHPPAIRPGHPQVDGTRCAEEPRSSTPTASWSSPWTKFHAGGLRREQFDDPRMIGRRSGSAAETKGVRPDGPDRQFLPDEGQRDNQQIRPSSSSRRRGRWGLVNTGQQGRRQTVRRADAAFPYDVVLRICR